MISKNEQIALSRRETREKRKTQICKVFEIKIKSVILNNTQKSFLRNIFLEAKWFWNDVVRSNNVIKYDCKNSTITRLDKDKNEFKYELRVLCSSLKQALVDEFKTNIKTLKSLKKKNKKVGRIGFCKEKLSVPLKQNGTTHKIIQSSNRIRIQGCKKPFPVFGLQQIPSHYEIANARLVAKATGYFIQIVTYHNEETKEEIENKNKCPALGLDFGIKNTVTTSKGSVFSTYVEETDRLKRFQKKLSRQIKRSNNWLKTLWKVKKEYQRVTNRKNDLSQKFVHKLLEENEIIVIQDDNFASWAKSKQHFGRKIQHGCLGRIKMLLKQHPKQVVVIEQFKATTKRCHKCDTIIEGGLGLNERDFLCPSCGHQEDRDAQAAKMILKFGVLKYAQKTVGVERTDQGKCTFCALATKPVESVLKTLNEAGIAYESMHKEKMPNI